MGYFKIIATICALVLLNGCASTSQVIRPAPKEGVQVTGLNVLFSIIPFDTVTSSGTYKPTTTTTAGAQVSAMPREQAEKLRDQIGERLMPQLRAKDLAADYASVHVIPGVAPTPAGKLFPIGVGERHLLLITPIAESKFCGAACSTRFTLSVSLRTPRDNREVWNLRLEQAVGSAADWVPNRNDTLIDDLAKSVLAVVVPTKAANPRVAAQRL